MKHLIALLLFGMTLTAHAQPMPDTLWTRTIPDHSPKAIKPTADGGFVLCGQTVPASGDRDGFVLKLDSAGSTEWETVLGDSGNDILNDVRPTRDGGYIAVGQIVPVVDRGLAFILRLDADGGTLWTRHWDFWETSTATLVLELESGEILLTVRADSDSAGAPNYLDVYGGTLQLDAGGNLVSTQWVRGWDYGSEYGSLTSVVALEPTVSDGYFLAHTTHNWYPNYPPYQVNHYFYNQLEKLVNWSRLWIWEYPSQPLLCRRLYKIAPFGDGGCVALTGCSIGVGWTDLEVTLVAADGSPGVAHSVGGHAVDLCAGPGNGYVTAAYGWNATQTNIDLWLFAYDADGEMRWQRAFSEAGDQWPTAIENAADGGYAILKRGSDTTAAIIRTGPDVVVPTHELPAVKPKSFILRAYPNPFNATTTIVFELPVPGEVELTLFDVTGRMVRTLAERRYAAGRQEVTLQANGLSSGIYFARLTMAGFTKTQKLLLVR